MYIYRRPQGFFRCTSYCPLTDSQIRVNRDGIFKLLNSPGIDSKKSIPPAYVACAGILEQSLGARNRVGKGLSYQPARARICKAFKGPRNRFPAWRNRFVCSINICKFGFSGYIGWRNRFLGIGSQAPKKFKHDNPIPTRFLAPMDCSKIPAQC